MDYQVIPGIMIFVGIVGAFITIYTPHRSSPEHREKLELVEILFHCSTLIGLGMLLAPTVCAL